jgi:hypothetical protein
MTKRGAFSFFCPFVQLTNCPLAQWQLLFPTVQYWHTMNNTNLYFESRTMTNPAGQGQAGQGQALPLLWTLAVVALECYELVFERMK